MSEALATVLRLRQKSLDDAGRALSDALAAQASAEHARMTAEQSIAAELAEASQPGPDDSVVEAFAAWLPGARNLATAAQDRLDHAVASAAQARAAVALARAALEAAESLAEIRRSEREKAQIRREQHTLDDLGRNHGVR